MRRSAVVVTVAMLVAACSAPSVAPHHRDDEPPSDQMPLTARLLFVGDVMVGRGVAAQLGEDPDDLFRKASSAIRSADLAAFNLESPLTTQPHLSTNTNDLRADPGLATALATAGFDVACLANNHTGDAGAVGIADTITAAHGAGMATIGTRPEDAPSSVILEVGGIRVGMAAFTQVESDGLADGTASWDPEAAEAEVRRLVASSDVVVVSFHGGSEGIPAADPEVRTISRRLAAWGADIVWGHGPHVPHPLDVIQRDDGGRTVIATSLGNFLFDQTYAPNQNGHVLEIITTRSGPIAYRIGRSHHTASGIDSLEWDLPSGDAVLLEDDWWSPVTSATAAPVEIEDLASFDHGDVIAAAWGDVTGDDTKDLVVAYRHAFRETPLNRLHPDHTWMDEEGRSAHIGVFTPDGTPIWGAGTLAYPIDEFAPCDGSVAVVYRTFAGEAAGVGALVWQGFGLADASILPGTGTPACTDLDGDGRLEPVIMRATSILRP